MPKPPPVADLPSPAPPREGMPEDGIYEEIHRAIARQDLLPGTRLREGELGGLFGASRARIRNVLVRLAYAGVVTLEPNRGASVRRPSPKDAADNFVARRAIEEAIVRLVAGRLGKADRRRLEANIEAERRARQAGDAKGVLWLSGEFHTLLAEIAGNAILAGILRDLVTREALVIATYERPGKPCCSHEEHAGILAALAAGDPDPAVRLMLEHLGAVEDRLHVAEPVPEPDLGRIFAGMAGARSR
ncbi:GntR family transcriptional regulator [Prosthecomicrobium sp. N25]|uniref:GntR family transcriptional regulator n=1 Tax=Prosthecomicrobium sp. N25 TaxID=3129254 RepID=UPI003076A9F4